MKKIVLVVIVLMIFSFTVIAVDQEFLKDKEPVADINIEEAKEVEFNSEGKVVLPEMEKPEDYYCSDTDGGRNYYEKGTAGEIEKKFTDYCQDEKRLFEHDCGIWGGVEMQDGVSHIGLGGVSYECPNGCVDGACVRG